MAVQGVSSEPVSADFPVMQGKYREFSRFRPESGPSVPYKLLNYRAFLSKFPTRRNREFESRIREISGNSFAQFEDPRCPLLPHKQT